jgi:hypothetical protein
MNTMTVSFFYCTPFVNVSTFFLQKCPRACLTLGSQLSLPEEVRLLRHHLGGLFQFLTFFYLSCGKGTSDTTEAEHYNC